MQQNYKITEPVTPKDIIGIRRDLRTPFGQWMVLRLENIKFDKGYHLRRYIVPFTLPNRM